MIRSVDLVNAGEHRPAALSDSLINLWARTISTRLEQSDSN